MKVIPMDVRISSDYQVSISGVNCLGFTFAADDIIKDQDGNSVGVKFNLIEDVIAWAYNLGFETGKI